MKKGYRHVFAGEDHPMAKLRTEDVKYIKENYVFDPRTRRSNSRALAERFGVSVYAIQKAVKRTRLASYRIPLTAYEQAKKDGREDE